MNIEVYRRLENALVHEAGHPYGGHGRMFLPYMPGKSSTLEIQGQVYRLEWDSETHATGYPAE